MILHRPENLKTDIPWIGLCTPKSQSTRKEYKYSKVNYMTMETRNLEELIKDYIAKNEVTNSIEAVIRDAYLAGYKARIKHHIKGVGW